MKIKVLFNYKLRLKCFHYYQKTINFPFKLGGKKEKNSQGKHIKEVKITRYCARVSSVPSSSKSNPESRDILTTCEYAWLTV